MEKVDTKGSFGQWIRCEGKVADIMGRAKKKRIAKRKKDMKRRISIREKMGKPIFFTLTHCSKKLHGISNKYNYKSNMHKLCFMGARFYNVKYQASIMTGCDFRSSNIIGVDFYNCNMKDISFKNTSFKNVVFYNCNLKDADFTGATFSNVAFICTNTSTSKNLNTNSSGIIIMCTYPKITLDEKTTSNLLNLANNETIFAAKVLHVNKEKLNNWAIALIQSRCGIQSIEFLDKILHKKENRNNLYTVFSYILRV